NPDGTDWLFVGQKPQPESTSPFISVAIRAPRLLNAAETIQYYAQDLVTPLLEAGLIGLAAAFLMSILITRSVARPLQDVARAASAVAHGRVDQRAPERGPREVRTAAGPFKRSTLEVK